LERLEIHYTPKHGSWLNMAEIELSVLARQCLDRRIPDQQTLAEEVGAWEAERNAYESSIDWRFTTQEARISSSSISIPRSWSHQMTQTLRDGTLVGAFSEVQLPRTPLWRSSHNAPPTHFGEYGPVVKLRP
jgi:hypothetical protein